MGLERVYREKAHSLMLPAFAVIVVVLVAALILADVMGIVDLGKDGEE